MSHYGMGFEVRRAFYALLISTIVCLVWAGAAIGQLDHELSTVSSEDKQALVAYLEKKTDAELGKDFRDLLSGSSSIETILSGESRRLKANNRKARIYNKTGYDFWYATGVLVDPWSHSQWVDPKAYRVSSGWRKLPKRGFADITGNGTSLFVYVTAIDREGRRKQISVEYKGKSIDNDRNSPRLYFPLKNNQFSEKIENAARDSEGRLKPGPNYSLTKFQGLNHVLDPTYTIGLDRNQWKTIVDFFNSEKDDYAVSLLQNRTRHRIGVQMRWSSDPGYEWKSIILNPGERKFLTTRGGDGQLQPHIRFYDRVGGKNVVKDFLWFNQLQSLTRPPTESSLLPSSRNSIRESNSKFSLTSDTKG